MARTIAVITGSRGEWGYIRPILKLIDADPELDYQLIVTHMHLLPEFGYSVQEIEKDGFTVHERIYMTFDGYTGATMTKSLAIFLLELPTCLERLKPDMMLLAGDRGEQLMAAIAGNHLAIPVGHIQAGELSGNVDGIIRHSITKLAHFHFAANKEFGDRVRKLGEDDFRIFETGAPLVDELAAGQVTSSEELAKRYRLDLDQPLILAVQHPVTEQESESGNQSEILLQSLIELELQTIFIYPNADAGSAAIREKIAMLKQPHIRFMRNLTRADYLGFMKMAHTMVGNSSSGIMEAPTFGTPAINIGRRQNRRPQAANVINCEFDKEEIKLAVKRACSGEFQEIAKKSKNPYGLGNASEQIVEVLKTIPLDDKLLRKEMSY